MNNDEYYINKIISDLKIYYKENKEGISFNKPSSGDFLKSLEIKSPEKIIKNSWLSGFGDVNKRLDKKFDTLLFGVSNKLFLFESFVLIKNRLSLKYYKSNKKHYIENNQNKYSFFENGQKREIDYIDPNPQLEIIDFKEFLDHELKYHVIKDSPSVHITFSLGDKSYYFDINSAELSTLSKIFDELLLLSLIHI